MDDPRGSVDLAESIELDLLRERAYGPDADIAGDPAAQARLSELEAARRSEWSPAVDPAPGAILQERIPGRPGDAPPFWRRTRLLVLGGAITALSLGVAVVAWITQPTASTPLPAETATMSLPSGQGDGSDAPEPDAVLAVDSVGADAAAPVNHADTLERLGIRAEELRRYEDFRGLNVWSAESHYGLSCLLVSAPARGLRDGFSDEGCSLKGHDTTADMPSLRGDGVLRFVLRGDHVDVYEYETRVAATASQG